MRRLKAVLEDARRKLAAGGDAIQVYKELGLDVAEMLADYQEQGFIQFAITFNPPGFKILLPKEETLLPESDNGSL